VHSLKPEGPLQVDFDYSLTLIYYSDEDKLELEINASNFAHLTGCVVFKVAILNHKGEHCLSRTLPPERLNTTQDWIKLPEYYQRNDLVVNGLLVDNRLGVYLQVSHNTDPLTTTLMKNTENSIYRSLNSKLIYLEPTDFTLLFPNEDSQKLYAHKSIFSAQIPFFERLFQHESLSENVHNQIELQEERFADWEQLLKFIYTEQLPSLIDW